MDYSRNTTVIEKKLAFPGATWSPQSHSIILDRWYSQRVATWFNEVGCSAVHVGKHGHFLYYCEGQYIEVLKEPPFTRITGEQNSLHLAQSAKGDPSTSNLGVVWFKTSVQWVFRREHASTGNEVAGETTKELHKVKYSNLTKMLLQD